MTEEFGTFTNFITKGFGTKVTKDGRRILKGHITVEVVDRQDEYVAVDEVLSVIKNYFEVYPAIHDWHSNRPVGKALNYKKSSIEGHASVYIEAEIFRKEGVTLYDNVWEKIVKGEYTGFSMGGASKVKEPIVKDGKLITSLKSLELYEISVCPLPANQLAIFDYVNDFAKASGLHVQEMLSGRRYIQCEGVQCQYHKNMDKHEYKCDGETNMCDRCGGSKEDKIHQMEKAYGNESKDLGKTSETQIIPEMAGTKAKTVFGVEKTGGLMKAIEDMTDEIMKQYQAFNKPVKGHPVSYWMNKLKEENPEMTDSECKDKIDLWIGEESEKKTVTKEMSRRAETIMDDAPKGAKADPDKPDDDSLMKDHIPSMTEDQEKKIKEKTKDENDMKPDQVVKDAGMQNSQAKGPNVKNFNPQEKPSELKVSDEDKKMGKADVDSDVDIDKTSGNMIKKKLESMIRKNTLILMLQK